MRLSKTLILLATLVGLVGCEYEALMQGADAFNTQREPTHPNPCDPPWDDADDKAVN